jgi:NADH-quinone oxidoreductase subunit J
MLEIIFFTFSLLIIFCGLFVINTENSVHSVLYLILVFSNAAGILLILEVEFLAMIFLIVYIGAIAVLFLFIVMMLDIKIAKNRMDLIKYLPIGSIIGFALIFEIFIIMNFDFVGLTAFLPMIFQIEYIDWLAKLDNIANINSLGQIIYTHYFFYFFCAGIVLLIAMIGAIVLTMEPKQIKRQHIYQQISRNTDFATFRTKMSKFKPTVS